MPQLTISTTTHAFHHNSRFPPHLTLSTTSHAFHRTSRFPSHLTLSITPHPFHHTLRFPSHLTLSITPHPFHNASPFPPHLPELYPVTCWSYGRGHRPRHTGGSLSKESRDPNYKILATTGPHREPDEYDLLIRDPDVLSSTKGEFDSFTNTNPINTSTLRTRLVARACSAQLISSSLTDGYRYIVYQFQLLNRFRIDSIQAVLNNLFESLRHSNLDLTTSKLSRITRLGIVPVPSCDRGRYRWSRS